MNRKRNGGTGGRRPLPDQVVRVVLQGRVADADLAAPVAAEDVLLQAMTMEFEGVDDGDLANLYVEFQGERITDIVDFVKKPIEMPTFLEKVSEYVATNGKMERLREVAERLDKTVSRCLNTMKKNGIVDIDTKVIKKEALG